MPRNEKRPPLVRSLRALARKLGVEDVAGDEVGRAQVASLAERLARVTGHSRDKKEARQDIDGDKTRQLPICNQP